MANRTTTVAALSGASLMLLSLGACGTNNFNLQPVNPVVPTPTPTPPTPTPTPPTPTPTPTPPTPTPTPTSGLTGVLDEVAKVVVGDTAVLGSDTATPVPLIGVAAGAAAQPQGQLATVGVANGGQLINVKAVGGNGTAPNPTIVSLQNSLGAPLGEVVYDVKQSPVGALLNDVNAQLGDATSDLLGGTGGLLHVNIGSVNLIGSKTAAVGIKVLSTTPAEGSTASLGLLTSGKLLNLQAIAGAGGTDGGQLGEALSPLTGTLGNALAPLGGTLGGVTGQVGGVVDGLTQSGAPLAPLTPVVGSVVGTVGGLLTGASNFGGATGGVLAPVTGLVAGATGGATGGEGGLLAPVTSLVGGLTGGLGGGSSSGGLLAPVTGLVGGLTGGLTGS